MRSARLVVSQGRLVGNWSSTEAASAREVDSVCVCGGRVLHGCGMTAKKALVNLWFICRAQRQKLLIWGWLSPLPGRKGPRPTHASVARRDGNGRVCASKRATGARPVGPVGPAGDRRQKHPAAAAIEGRSGGENGIQAGAPSSTVKMNSQAASTLATWPLSVRRNRPGATAWHATATSMAA